MIHFYIKEIASEKGMTLTDVCNKVGYKSLPSFYRQINNPESVSMKTLIKIADALGCEVNDLFVQPSNQEKGLTCPKCGTKLELKAVD